MIENNTANDINTIPTHNNVVPNVLLIAVNTIPAKMIMYDNELPKLASGKSADLNLRNPYP